MPNKPIQNVDATFIFLWSHSFQEIPGYCIKEKWSWYQNNESYLLLSLKQYNVMFIVNIINHSSSKLNNHKKYDRCKHPYLNFLVHLFDLWNWLVFSHFLPNSNNPFLVSSFQFKFHIFGNLTLHSFFHKFIELHKKILGNHS